MKLRTKKDIDTNVSSQTKTNIDQGISLARRVDTLRLKVVEEERKLTYFKEVTQKVVAKEIAVEIDKKHSLQKEVKELELKRDELLVPLDNEWKEVLEVQSYLKLRKAFLAEKDDIVSTLLEQTKKKEGDTETNKQKSEDLKVRSEKELEIAHNSKLESHQLLKKTKSEYARMESYVKGEEDKLEHRESVILSTVNDMEIREKEVVLAEEEISREKLVLADRRQTLERAMKRLQK